MTSLENDRKVYFIMYLNVTICYFTHFYLKSDSGATYSPAQKGFKLLSLNFKVYVKVIIFHDHISKKYTTKSNIIQVKSQHGSVKINFGKQICFYRM